MLAMGRESQLDVAGWTATERFRVASLSRAPVAPFTSLYLPTAEPSRQSG